MRTRTLYFTVHYLLLSSILLLIALQALIIAQTLVGNTEVENLRENLIFYASGDEVLQKVNGSLYYICNNTSNYSGYIDEFCIAHWEVINKENDSPAA